MSFSSESWIVSTFRESAAFESIEIASSALMDEVLCLLKKWGHKDISKIAHSYLEDMGPKPVSDRFADRISGFVTVSEPLVREVYEACRMDLYFSKLHTCLNQTAYDLHFDHVRTEFENLQNSDPQKALAAASIVESYELLGQLVNAISDPGIVVDHAILDAQRQLTPSSVSFSYQILPTHIERWERARATANGIVARAFSDLTPREWLTFLAFLSAQAGHKAHRSAAHCFAETVEEELAKFLLPYVKERQRPR